MQMFPFFNLAFCQSARQIVFVVLIGISQSSEATMLSHCLRRRFSSYMKRNPKDRRVHKFPLPSPLRVTVHATIHILLWHANGRNEIYHLHKIYLVRYSLFVQHADKQTINRIAFQKQLSVRAIFVILRCVTLLSRYVCAVGDKFN